MSHEIRTPMSCLLYTNPC
ncbi:hypothetical protein [Pseudoalteromonas sp. SWYJZ98]